MHPGGCEGMGERPGGFFSTSGGVGKVRLGHLKDGPHAFGTIRVCLDRAVSDSLKTLEVSGADIPVEGRQLVEGKRLRANS